MHAEGDISGTGPSLGALRAGVAGGVGLVAGALIILHTPYLNGPPFWPWPWRVLPPVTTYAVLAVAALPFFVAQWVYARRRRTGVALAVLMLGCLGMKLASVLPYTDPPSLEMIRVIVENPDATSYYTDAAGLRARHASVREWLDAYHEYMPGLSLHSKTKAPGPILYWTAVIHFFGVSRAAAMVGGVLIGALATLSIAATYLLVRSLTRDKAAAFHAASLLSLAPGFVLFFPMFDPTYPILSCALVGLWALAVERDDWRAAAAVGAVLALVCTISFNVLVIGAFMALYPLVVPDRPMRAKLLTTLKHGTIALVTWLVLIAALRPLTGYDAVATFRSAWRNQHVLLSVYAHTRPYPATVPFDLTDFALGAGWVAVAVVAFYFARTSREDPKRLRRLSALCVAQLVLVAVTGLLQSETARVWNFMLPLLMIPAGLELRRWSFRDRLIAYAATWFVLAAVAQNVKFIY